MITATQGISKLRYSETKILGAGDKVQIIINGEELEYYEVPTDRKASISISISGDEADSEDESVMF
jgi:hypothetical protein